MNTYTMNYLLDHKCTFAYTLMKTQIFCTFRYNHP